MNTTHVDWYSFTCTMTNSLAVGDSMLQVVSNVLEYNLGFDLYMPIFADTDGWLLGNGRRPYKGGYSNTSIGCSVWFGGQTTILIEFSGRGCQWLRDNGMLGAIIEKTHHRATRIDIAIDVPEIDCVNEIADSIGNGRIKTIGSQVSDTGKTRYIGSRKSDRFCRVYAYTSPDNPRYGSTRVEYEHKGAQARLTAYSVVSNGVIYTAAQIGNFYQWSSLLMTHDISEVEKLPTKAITREESKTIEWLRKQVRPAIKRVIEEQAIDNPAQWILDTLLPMEYMEMKEVYENEEN